MHLLFTGGDASPALSAGLAVAERLLDDLPARAITFAGSCSAPGRRQIAERGFQYLAVRCRRPPERWREVLPAWWANRLGYCAALDWIDRHRPAAVIGLGGDDGLPAARAAADRQIPLVLIEPELSAGAVARRLAGRAAVICTAYDETAAALRRGEIRLTGAPVREGLVSGLKTGRQLLILDRSVGCRQLGDELPAALAALARLATWKIVHQTEADRVAAIRKRYAELGLEAVVVDESADVPRLMAESELAVARPDGVTLAELAAAGAPAILVAEPENERQHRLAERFAAAGACAIAECGVGLGDCGRERPPSLAASLDVLLGDLARRLAMAHTMSRLARPEATAEVAAIIARVAFGRRTVVVRRRKKTPGERRASAAMS